MKKILVATDFSINSESAIKYALNLAQIFNAEIHMINSYISIPAIGIDGGPGILNEDVTQAGVDANKSKLEDLAKTMSEESNYGNPIITVVTTGDPVITISDYAVENNFDLLILGTKGESRLEEILFGSTSVDIMKQSRIPVLAVPSNAKYYGIQKIVYATELEEKDIAVIQHLCDFAKFFDAEVVVFHVFTEDNMTQQDEADKFNKLLNKNVTYQKLFKESVTYANTYDAILDVIKKDLANMIALREQNRGIFGRLFHIDMVKRINDHTTIPLLTYNDKSL